jgi:hypothetical protein
LQEEFYATAFRKKLYTSLEERQADLDLWLAEYSQTRPHSGRYCYGKTPMAPSCYLSHDRGMPIKPGSSWRIIINPT